MSLRGQKPLSFAFKRSRSCTKIFWIRLRILNRFSDDVVYYIASVSVRGALCERDLTLRKAITLCCNFQNDSIGNYGDHFLKFSYDFANRIGNASRYRNATINLQTMDFFDLFCLQFIIVWLIPIFHDRPTIAKL